MKLGRRSYLYSASRRALCPVLLAILSWRAPLEDRVQQLEHGTQGLRGVTGSGGRDYCVERWRGGR